MTFSGNISQSLEEQIAVQLDLLPGDIVFSEAPYEDASHEDFTHFDNLAPGHTCVWVNKHSTMAFARSHQEGYQPPGLTLTGLWPGRHSVFRYIADANIALEFSIIMKNWASQLTSGMEMVSQVQGAPAYLSAANDLFALFKNPNLVNLGSEGLRRAVKYASQRHVMGEPDHRGGQRCTAMVVAAFQASILAAIVKPQDNILIFQREKGSHFLDYADLVMELDWRKHPLGIQLLKALEKNDFSLFFPRPFAIDQRYATPKQLYLKVQESIDFSFIGHYSYFNHQIIAVEKNTLLSAKTLSQNR